MSELTDLLERLNLTAEDIRQAVLQASTRSTAGGGALGAGGPSSGPSSGGVGSALGAAATAGSGPSRAALDAAAAQSKSLADGLTGKLGQQLGTALQGGVSGLGSFAKNAISNGLGGGLAGSGAGAGFDLFLRGTQSIIGGQNSSIAAAPSFASQSFVDQAGQFGRQEGFNRFFRDTLGLGSLPIIGEAIAQDDRKIREQRETAETPILRASASLEATARAIGEQGGDVDLDAFRQLAPIEIARQRRGFDAETAVRQIVTSFGATDPSSSLQMGRR